MKVNQFTDPMKLKPKITILDYFSEIKDPRVDRTKEHLLIDIITIAICAVICGADTWVGIETFGNAKFKWLKKFLKLPNGIPSHDTFARVIAMLDPQEFQECFLNWVQSISKITESEVVAIDGKTLRHSYDRGGKKGAIHMVSAWATEARLVLGQKKVDDKSNEITAIPELIKVLELAGCIVTIDAMGCQREIVKQIVQKQADYVIAVKLNQKTLYEDIESLFKKAIRQRFEGFKASTYSTKEVAHGREEIRHYVVINEIADIIDPDKKWSNLQSIGMVESVRTLDGKTSAEIRYYITSRINDAKSFGNAVRNHWGIENPLHWVLDVSFHEDACRIRKGNAAQNFAVLRHIVMNLMNQEKSSKLGMKNKRLKAAWDEKYLEKVLNI